MEGAHDVMLEQRGELRRSVAMREVFASSSRIWRASYASRKNARLSRRVTRRRDALPIQATATPSPAPTGNGKLRLESVRPRQPQSTHDCHGDGCRDDKRREPSEDQQVARASAQEHRDFEHAMLHDGVRKRHRHQQQEHDGRGPNPEWKQVVN